MPACGTATSAFSGADNGSNWYAPFQQYEALNFAGQLSHKDATNSNRSWQLRFGRGGNVYSLRGPFGEAIPPQVRHGVVSSLSHCPETRVTRLMGQVVSANCDSSVNGYVCRG
jgi:hypothetical protein